MGGAEQFLSEGAGVQPFSNLGSARGNSQNRSMVGGGVQPFRKMEGAEQFRSMEGSGGCSILGRCWALSHFKVGGLQTDANI
jgi:hypothetical protein